VELMKYYRGVKLEYMNIGNIHAVRESSDMMHALFQSNWKASDSFYDRLEATGWLSHLNAILSGTVTIVKAIHYDECGILVHCSDGWDRTSQLVALAMLCLDPFYRTIQGLQVLIEKEWLAFGHKFSDRSAHSNKAPSEERSPIFVLWLDCIWQIMRQYPTILEFNDQLLLALCEHVYSCRFGTFLCNNLVERMNAEAKNKTVSFWSWVQERYEMFLNPSFEEYTEGPVIPSTNPKNIQLWDSYFLRYDLSGIPARAPPQKLL